MDRTDVCRDGTLAEGGNLINDSRMMDLGGHPLLSEADDNLAKPETGELHV